MHTLRNVEPRAFELAGALKSVGAWRTSAEPSPLALLVAPSQEEHAPVCEESRSRYACPWIGDRSVAWSVISGRGIGPNLMPSTWAPALEPTRDRTP